MSDAVSALAGAAYEGYCKISEAGRVGMVTIRGQLDHAGVKRGVERATGLSMPGQGEIIGTPGGPRLAWMSPDEVMLFCEAEAASGQVAALSQALAAQFALAVDVSDARSVFRIEGQGAREVIAKLSPVDIAPEAFGPGRMRRTRLGQVPAAFHMPDDTTVEVIAFRSVARYVFDLLSNAAKPGSEVGLFAT